MVQKEKLTLPETNSLPLKMDGWNTSFLLGWPTFRGELLVSGRVIGQLQISESEVKQPPRSTNIPRWTIKTPLDHVMYVKKPRF